MNRKTYFEVRNALYSAVGIFGDNAERINNHKEKGMLKQASALDDTYARGCEMLDAIDVYGSIMGWIDAETNEEIEGEIDEN